jgi:hypothetical protein
VLASKAQGEAFHAEVRAIEGLPAKAGTGLAQSGKSRVGSQIPGLVRNGVPGVPGVVRGDAEAPARGRAREAGFGMDDAMAPMGDTSRRPPEPEGVDFEAAADDFLDSRHNQTRSSVAALDAFGQEDMPPAARSEAARSEAPSKMRQVDHGITVDNDIFKMAEKIQSNDSTLRMLASLDFDGAPGPEAVDQRIEAAIANGEAPPTPMGDAPEPGEIERADVASARATAWPERASKPPAGRPQQNVNDAARSGDAAGMTAAFLADLLDE